MKLRVERDELVDAVTWASRGLPQRPPNPILSNIRIEAKPDGITVSAFDYEVSATSTVPAEVTTVGTMLVDGRIMQDITKSLPAPLVELTQEGNRAVLSCGAAHFNLSTGATEQYPELPTMPTASGTVSGKLFSQAISQVAISADRGDSLPILTSMHIEVSGDKITLLATDRYRLSRKTLNWKPADDSFTATLQIPARNLYDTVKTLDPAAQVELSFGDDSKIMGMTSGSRHSTSTLMDGDYPKVSGLIPQDFVTTARMVAGDLLGVIKRVSIVSAAHAPIRLRFSEGQVSVEAGSGEDSNAQETMPCLVEGPDIEMNLNPNMLREGLSVLGNEYVHMSFTDSAKPVLINGAEKPDSEIDDSFQYLLMPIRFPN